MVPVSCSSSSGSQSSSLTVSRKSFAGDWPLLSDDATVVCGKQDSISVGVNVNGKTYALNGTAKANEGWPGLRPVWASNPIVEGLKVSVGDLLDYAAEKCANK